MQELSSQMIRTGDLGGGFLRLPVPIEFIDGESSYGRMIKLFNSHVSFILSDGSEALVDIKSLEKVDLSRAAIDRIIEREPSDRWEDLKETLLVRSLRSLKEGISPWHDLAKNLQSKISEAVPPKFTHQEKKEIIARCKQFFSSVIDLRKTQLFVVIKIENAFHQAIILGRRGSQGEIFVVSKDCSYETIAKGRKGDIRGATVLELSSFQEETDRRIAIKEVDLIEREGHLSVQDIDEGIIEVLGEVVSEREMLRSNRIHPIPLVFPRFLGSALDYLVDLLSAKEPISNERLSIIFMEVFRKLAEVLEKMHEKNLVHSDVKLDNVFLQWGSSDEMSLQKVVLADFGNTDPLNEYMTITPSYTFLEEYESAIRATREKNGELCKEIRKRMDVRQFGFFMYDVFSLVKREAEYVRLTPYPEMKSGFPNFKKSYRDLSQNVPIELQDLIRDMLSPDEMKVPTMNIVSERLNQMNF